ncbi:MAG: HEAT repeat domain-containing protein [Planctomycetales bacterium]|nr:HEAT repeat domain-containing protein [Planctomycetales bacterium]
MRAALLSLLLVLPSCGLIHSRALAQDGDKPKPPLTGPETEKRFPPLKVPRGFRATLFACDPLIEYPSVMSAGPRPGAVFVAVDYMTGLGTEITRRSEVRLVEDTNGDGYADKATLYAGGFNSIMGLCYHDGTVFVMHAPFLTALKDTKGTGVADERKDIVTGLGLTPEENPVRLHCANGVTAGHDGWLYLALGDHGCIVNRPEGDKLVLEGGGILRCRPDGRDLHIFSTGLRNIYDVALDAELNVFVRDNENDGGDYKIRLCHSFFGVDHGYPYDYYERPGFSLPPIADLGLGSSAGGVCYLETQFPPQYRGLFFCEWGKSLVRYELQGAEGNFIPSREYEFAAGAETDPYGFKPTDVVVQRDGTIMVSDYADGQRPKRGRGRIYYIEWDVDPKPTPSVTKETSLEELLEFLDSRSYYLRCESQRAIEQRGEAGAKAVSAALAEKKLQPLGSLHAIWILAHVQRDNAIEQLLKIAEEEKGDERIRAQAVKAVADLVDPVLVKHRLDAPSGDAGIAERLAKIRRGSRGPLQLETLIALGRLKWAPLAEHLQKFQPNEPAMLHAAGKALRRAGNWPATLRLLDGEDRHRRVMALQAMADIPDPVIVDGLIERLEKKEHADHRRLYADALTRVYKKPAPWVYWDYRPKPRPANTVAWERTEAIEAALNKVLLSKDLLSTDNTELAAILKRMQREKIPAGLEAIGKWLAEEWNEEYVTLLIEALREHPARDIRPHLTKVIREGQHSDANRLLAIDLYTRGPDAPSAEEFLKLTSALGDSPILAALLRHAAPIAKDASIPLLQEKLASKDPTVQVAAIEGLTDLKAGELRSALATLLTDRSTLVRRAAAMAAGKLEEREVVEPLLKLAADPDPQIRVAAFGSLLILHAPQATALAAASLADVETQVIALKYLREHGDSEFSAPVIDLAKRTPSAVILSNAVPALTRWRFLKGITIEQVAEIDRGIAEIQGASGSLLRWTTAEKYHFSVGEEGRAVLEKGNSAETTVIVSEPTAVEFLATSSAPLEIQLGGKTIYKRDKPQEFRLDSDRFAAMLVAGENHLTVLLGESKEMPGQFQLRFRRKSATAAHEKLIAAALSRSGNIEQGQKVFQNIEKSNCLKCHRDGSLGEKTGPELTGLGSRFSRIYIAESILDPNRTIAPSFGTLVVRLDSGQVLSGIKIAETENFLTLVDSQAQKHVLNKADIEEQKSSPLSTMPEGLEKKLSENEFVDLVAYLASLKESKP